MAGAVLFLFVAICQPALSASINYGDFNGNTVMFTDVTESSDDPLPLYGAPNLAGDSLHFSPQQFLAKSDFQVPPSDTTDGQLTFGVMAFAGEAIKTISFEESGAFSVTGFLANTTNDTFAEATAVGNITVLAIDGNSNIDPVVIPINLPIVFDPNTGPNVATNRWRFLSEGGNSGSWSGAQGIDIKAALIAAGRQVSVGATKIEVNLDNILKAQSEPFGSARIDKKLFLKITTTETIPEPTSLVLIGIMVMGLWAGCRPGRV